MKILHDDGSYYYEDELYDMSLVGSHWKEDSQDDDYGSTIKHFKDD